MIDMAAGSSSEHHMDYIRRAVPYYCTQRLMWCPRRPGASWRARRVPLEPPVDDRQPPSHRHQHPHNMKQHNYLGSHPTSHNLTPTARSTPTCKIYICHPVSSKVLESSRTAHRPHGGRGGEWWLSCLGDCLSLPSFLPSFLTPDIPSPVTTRHDPDMASETGTRPPDQDTPPRRPSRLPRPARQPTSPPERMVLCDR